MKGKCVVTVKKKKKNINCRPVTGHRLLSPAWRGGCTTPESTPPFTRSLPTQGTGIKCEVQNLPIWTQFGWRLGCVIPTCLVGPWSGLRKHLSSSFFFSKPLFRASHTDETHFKLKPFSSWELDPLSFSFFEGSPNKPIAELCGREKPRSNGSNLISPYR